MWPWYDRIKSKGGFPIASTAQKAANARHAEKLDQLRIQPTKEEGQRIRQAAAEAGQSVNKYVLDAVRARMERDQANKKTDV